MKQVKIAELKDHLSKHLRAVERGEEIEVTDRQRPIVRLVPVAPTAIAEFLPAQVDPGRLRGRRNRPARWAVNSLDLLLADRRKR
jgi:prevent-host-death family protein